MVLSPSAFTHGSFVQVLIAVFLQWHGIHSFMSFPPPRKVIGYVSDAPSPHLHRKQTEQCRETSNILSFLSPMIIFQVQSLFSLFRKVGFSFLGLKTFFADCEVLFLDLVSRGFTSSADFFFLEEGSRYNSCPSSASLYSVPLVPSQRNWMLVGGWKLLVCCYKWVILLENT